MAIVHDKLTESLKKLFELSIDTAMSLMERDKTFLPFMFRQNINTKEHVVFTGDERANKEEFDKILEATLHSKSTLRFVFTYTGYLKSDEGHRMPAVILEGSEKGLDTGFIFAQRFTLTEKGVLTWLTGNNFLRLTDKLRMP